MLPTYEEASQSEEGHKMRSVFTFEPSFIDGIRQPFSVPHQIFGENVQNTIECLALPHGQEIHDLCFAVTGNVHMNMWQAHLSGSRHIGPHASEVVDTMEIDVRACLRFS